MAVASLYPHLFRRVVVTGVSADRGAIGRMHLRSWRAALRLDQADGGAGAAGAGAGGAGAGAGGVGDGEGKLSLSAFAWALVLASHSPSFLAAQVTI